MRIGAALVTAIALVNFCAVARATQTDCEPARCAVQAAINSQCDCSGAGNHGRYVSCVAHVVKALADAGTIPVNCKGKVKRCAARSTCGKSGFVTCSIPVDGTCDLLAHTCTGDVEVACTSNADCARCKIKSTAEGCVAAGGTVGTSATCCANCAP